MEQIEKHQLIFGKNILGMKLIFEQPNLDDLSINHLYFDCGDGRTVTVFTNETRIGKTEPLPNPVGSVHHLAFWVSQSTIRIAEKKLKERGIGSSGIKDRGFMDSIYFRDPLGLLIELATYKFDGYEDDTTYYLNELNKELNRQFYKDGTNFEGSSHYSAFVTEALIIFKLSLDEIEPDSSLIELIEKLVFSNRRLLNLLMVNGELSQIGDNDSGRLFYFYHDEDNPLKMNWLINLIDLFFLILKIKI